MAHVETEEAPEERLSRRRRKRQRKRMLHGRQGEGAERREGVEGVEGHDQDFDCAQGLHSTIAAAATTVITATTAAALVRPCAPATKAAGKHSAGRDRVEYLGAVQPHESLQQAALVTRQPHSGSNTVPLKPISTQTTRHHCAFNFVTHSVMEKQRHWTPRLSRFGCYY